MDFDAELIAHNVQLIRNHLRNEELNDYDGVFAEMTEPAEYYIASTRESLIGRDAILTRQATLLGLLVDLHLGVQSIGATETHGWVELLVSAKVKDVFEGLPAGTPISYGAVGIFQFRDGKISKEIVYHQRPMPTDDAAAPTSRW